MGNCSLDSDAVDVRERSDVDEAADEFWDIEDYNVGNVSSQTSQNTNILTCSPL
jgi:hypothetical protein